MEKLTQVKNKDRYNIIKEEYGTDETPYWTNVNDKQSQHLNAESGIATTHWTNVNDKQSQHLNAESGIATTHWTNVDNNKKIHQDELSNLYNPGVNNTNSWNNVDNNKKIHQDELSNLYNPGVNNTNSWNNVNEIKKNKGSYRHTPNIIVVESIDPLQISKEKNRSVNRG